ncbi:FecR family protein, partial [Thermaurantiacus sp.]
MQPATGGDSADFIIYEAEEGDRLSDLADRHFLRPDDWRKARALNGLSDDRLKAGTRIRLDTAWLRRVPLSAEVVAFRGDSVILKGARRMPVARGAILAEGDRIMTGAVGFVTLRLSDGSELSIPTNSSVRFLRLRGYTLGDLVDRRLQVEQGSLDNKVRPLGRPGHRHEVTTPVSVAAVRGTAFRVSFTPGSSTAITEVLEGRVGVLALGKSPSAETLVPAEHGVVATAAGVGRVEAMLPPPILAGAGPAFRGTRLATAVRREAGIKAWRLELATDAAFTNRVAELLSADGEFDVGELSPGLYHARLRAISPSGIAGRPTTFTVRGPGLAAASAAPPAAGGGPSGQEPPAGDAEVASLGEGPTGLRKMVADMAESAEDAAPFLEPFFAGEEGDASDPSAMAAGRASGGGGGGGSGGGGGG